MQVAQLYDYYEKFLIGTIGNRKREGSAEAAYKKQSGA